MLLHHHPVDNTELRNEYIGTRSVSTDCCGSAANIVETGLSGDEQWLGLLMPLILLLAVAMWLKLVRMHHEIHTPPGTSY